MMAKVPKQGVVRRATLAAVEPSIVVAIETVHEALVRVGSGRFTSLMAAVLCGHHAWNQRENEQDDDGCGASHLSPPWMLVAVVNGMDAKIFRPNDIP